MSQYDHDLCVLLVNDTYGELSSVSLNASADRTTRRDLLSRPEITLPTDVLQRVFEGLLRYGRSTLPPLQHVTRLSLRQSKHALSVLVQQQLVFWHRSLEDGLVSYEANLSAAYNLLRAGKYVKIAENRIGEFASTVISHLLLLGHARVGDLMQAYGIGYTNDMTSRLAAKTSALGRKTPKMKHTSHEVNGNESATREEINQTLCELLRAGLVVPVHETDMLSKQDKRTEAETTVGVLAEYKIKGKSKREIQALWEAEVRVQLHQWKFGSKEERSEIEALKVGRKRPLEGSDESPAEKRQRLDVAANKQRLASAGGGGSKLILNGLLKNELVVRINHEKFAVTRRNDHLIHLARQAIGDVTSQVYEKVLRKLEVKTLACCEESEVNDDAREEEDMSDLPSVTTSEVAAMFSDTSELDNAIRGNDPQMNEDISDHPKRRRRKPNGIQDEVTVELDASGDEADYSGSSGDESDDISVIDIDSDQNMVDNDYTPNGGHIFAPSPHHQAIRQHLLLLSQHQDRFFYRIRATPTEPERWGVNFHVLRRTSVLKTIFHTIDTRLGTLSTRLARICQEYGRMDDKSLQAKSLLTQKEMRARLLEMQKAGLLELQEVPRDNSRLASRTTFLYYVDEGKAKAKITDECYKTMTRCLQRLAVEKEKVAAVLEKVERSDVKGREEELLGAKEKEALGRWKRQEEMIWGELGRVDDVVAVLRDF